MNDIYWHDKRTMPSKQLSSPPPTQPRRAYENTLRSKHYQQTDFRFNSHLTNISTDNSSYLPYPTISARSHNKNDNFPWQCIIKDVEDDSENSSNKCSCISISGQPFGYRAFYDNFCFQENRDQILLLYR